MASSKTRSTESKTPKPGGKEKTVGDAKLIKKLSKYDPLDWARYPDGRLVFISPDGKKYSLSRKEIEILLKTEKPQPSSPEV